jgi:hypothetical protein
MLRQCPSLFGLAEPWRVRTGDRGQLKPPRNSGNSSGHENGYIEGQNLAIKYRNAEGQYDRLSTLATELVREELSAIAVFGLPAVLAVKAATTRRKTW